jgi:1,4-alpha-glucan branching enzyme
MQGYLSLVLHAHLPFVRHPEHERFLEENWLFEAITDTYVPLLRTIEGWSNDRMQAPISLTLSPTLCTMLMDPLLQSRYRRHLDDLLDLAKKEIQHTLWERPIHELACFYRERFESVRDYYDACQGDLIGKFRRLQDCRLLEILTCSATHAVLPLLADHPPSLRAQILTACDHYRNCFGRDPEGIWLPECAYAEAIEPVLSEAKLRWFITETQGLLHANPLPRYGMFAPILSPTGLAVFGRDLDSAKQVWSRQEGYPGDASYRDFYRDIGFDLDLDYLRPYLPAPDQRSFTGFKYYRITGPGHAKELYDPKTALAKADEHAGHFLTGRMDQIRKLTEIMDNPPLVLSPYDAELFGHWWYEGVEFLNFFVRKAFFDQKVFRFITPGQFLRQHPTHQVAKPAAGSWGEGGYWGVWLNEQNEWIYPHLRVAQERMTELVRRFSGPVSHGQATKPRETLPQPLLPERLRERALRQAGRELLLAQASDWPFILRTGTSPGYARKRVTEHLIRFSKIYEQLLSAQLNEDWLAQIESQDNIFPDLDFRYFGPRD